MRIWKIILGILTVLTVLVWISAYKASDSYLHIIACDVGQGDAILVTYKNIQVLTDGGLPNGKAVECLNSHLPFWDKEIELVVLTHPQLDHYGGLIGVFKDFKVDNFLANSVDGSSGEYSLLKNIVGSRGVRVINPRQDMNIRVGLIHLDVFNPLDSLYQDEKTQIVANSQKTSLGAFVTKRDLNDFSIVDKLTFGKFRAIFTGDIGPAQLTHLLNNSADYSAEYIKVPHHGSNNGLTQEFLNAVNPKLAVISVGKNNRYGHPNKELLKMLTDSGVPFFRTDEKGDVEIVSDGERFWLAR